MFSVPVAEPRIRRRYAQLMMGQLCASDRLAAGVHAPPGLMAEGFAATQAAWRFYGNDRIGLPQLCGPLIEQAVAASARHCEQFTPVALDWCNVHLNGHEFREDRVALGNGSDLGYEMLTALALGDVHGEPLAPVCVELRAADGVHTTRCVTVQKPASVLDGLLPVMTHVSGLALAKPPVFVIDKEADAIEHYRQWSAAGHRYLVRADDTRRVVHDGQDKSLRQVVDELRPTMKEARPVQIKSKPATQFVAETTVILNRPAYPKRTVKGKEKRRVIRGRALPLRLVVAEVRDQQGKVLALWLLLSNATAPASTIALWYYWRWKIESYHKLLKSAGAQLEHWRQETAAGFTRRLLVTAMAAVVVWHIARDRRPEIEPLRTLLVRLSGRQRDRKRNPRPFTEPMLLAGLNVLAPMLELLETKTVEQLRADAGPVYEMIKRTRRRRSADTG
jgi:hypothetical protein